MERVWLIIISLVLILWTLVIKGNDMVFIRTQIGNINHDHCAQIYRMTKEKRAMLRKIELGEGETKSALVIDDMPFFCGEAFLKPNIETWAPIMIFPRDCERDKNENLVCQWCNNAGTILKHLEKVGVETVILYNRIVKKVDSKPNMVSAAPRRNDTNISISFINANRKPDRNPIPFQSSIEGTYFNPEMEELDKKNLKIALWQRTYQSNIDDDRLTRVSLATSFLTILATLSVWKGSRMAAPLGYQTYLKMLSKRKRDIAKFILRGAMEKKRIREELGLRGQKIEDIMQEQVVDLVQKSQKLERDGNNNNTSQEDQVMVLSIKTKVPKKKEGSCDKKLAAVAFLGFIFISAMLVVFWLARDFVFDIFDGVFILASVCLMVGINKVVQCCPCGRKKVIWYEPKCCNGKEDEENDSSLDPYFAKFLNEETTIEPAKKKCCQTEMRQIIGGIFCLGLGVLWYIFRMSYAYVFGLHLLINISLMWSQQSFIGRSILPKFQYVVFLCLFILIYDIFMVHITPFFTKSGTSIMVDVAMKQGVKGNLPRIMPFVIYFPDVFPSTESTCMGVKYASILGLGDLFFPAIVFLYTHIFELVTRKEGSKVPPCNSIYALVCTVAYFLSLVSVNLVLLFTSNPQPALEFIVPYLLIAVFLTAACRGEAKRLWNLDYHDYPPMEELLVTVRQELIDMKKADATRNSDTNGNNIGRSVQEEPQEESLS